MPDQIYVGNFPKGLKTDRVPFVIDNNTFSNLFNAYVWRGRAKRKRGTQLLGRLTVQVVSVASPTHAWQDGPITVTAGALNLLTFVTAPSGASLVPGTVDLTVNGQHYVEATIPNGTLKSAAKIGTINYATGAILLSDVFTGTGIGTFSYYPGLPVMGLRDFTSSVTSAQFPITIAFDTLYSYQINQTTSPVTFYNINYYKFTNVPFLWSGQDYQQFWTTNFPST